MIAVLHLGFVLDVLLVFGSVAVGRLLRLANDVSGADLGIVLDQVVDCRHHQNSPGFQTLGVRDSIPIMLIEGSKKSTIAVMIGRDRPKAVFGDRLVLLLGERSVRILGRWSVEIISGHAAVFGVVIGGDALGGSSVRTRIEEASQLFERSGCFGLQVRRCSDRC